MDNRDIIHRLYQTNDEYFRLVPPALNDNTVIDDLNSLPPNKTMDDKFFLGYFDENENLIAVMDLILRYPNEDTAFIGLFMLDKNYQGKGIGKKILKDTECLLNKEFKYIRLGYVDKNIKAKYFWLNNGYKATGIISKQELYDVVILEKKLND